MRHAATLSAAIACCALVAAAAPVIGESLKPQLRILDGDTISLNGEHIRLLSIDAPELAQRCADGWPAGVEARAMLRDLIGSGPVTCSGDARDRYGRRLGHCSVPGTDLNAAMVAQGMAYAYVRYSHEYQREEFHARAAKRGVWAHDCAAPWEYRKAHR